MSHPVRTLPADILTKIVEQYLLSSGLQTGLNLRCINKWFDHEVIRLLFIVQIKDLKDIVRTARVPQHLALAQLQGFFTRQHISQKNDRRARRAVFRAVGFDPDAGVNIKDTCFAYRPGQPCVYALTGPSTSSKGPDCKIHDTMNAIISAFGPEVFNLGSDTNNDSYDKPASKTSQYYSLLLACYRKKTEEVQSTLHEIKVEQHLPEESVIRIYCNLFLIAARGNDPEMLKLLQEESQEIEEVCSRLGKQGALWNSLIEAVKLGHCEVVEVLLKWKWKFNNLSWSYLRIIKLILYCKLYVSESEDQPVRENLLRLMFRWTENWRNIEEMKGFLIKVGVNNLTWALEMAVEILKSEHHFRHERGNEGSFSAGEPLVSIAGSGNVELIKLYYDHRKLFLPHTTDNEHRNARRYAIAAEFAREEVRIDVLKTIVEYSGDLIESKNELAQLLLKQTLLPHRIWGWLAEKVGYGYPLESAGSTTLGGCMLSEAVNNLNVDTVQYLVRQGVRLDREVTTFQVDEGDAELMERLKRVRQALRGAGQGQTKQKRIIETTFLPTKTERPGLTPISTTATIRGSIARPETYCPRFLRRNLIAKNRSLRKTSDTSSRGSSRASDSQAVKVKSAQ